MRAVETASLVCHRRIRSARARYPGSAASMMSDDEWAPSPERLRPYLPGSRSPASWLYGVIFTHQIGFNFPARAQGLWLNQVRTPRRRNSESGSRSLQAHPADGRQTVAPPVDCHCLPSIDKPGPGTLLRKDIQTTSPFFQGGAAAISLRHFNSGRPIVSCPYYKPSANTAI